MSIPCYTVLWYKWHRCKIKRENIFNKKMLCDQFLTFCVSWTRIMLHWHLHYNCIKNHQVIKSDFSTFWGWSHITSVLRLLIHCYLFIIICFFKIIFERFWSTMNKILTIYYNLVSDCWVTHICIHICIYIVIIFIYEFPPIDLNNSQLFGRRRIPWYWYKIRG